METNIRQQNKLLLRGIVRQLPKKIKYAERIVQHLQRQARRQGKTDYKITVQMVYQTATGTSYNPLIAYKIAVLYRAYRIANVRINKTLRQLTPA